MFFFVAQMYTIRAKTKVSKTYIIEQQNSVFEFYWQNIGGIRFQFQLLAKTSNFFLTTEFWFYSLKTRVCFHQQKKKKTISQNMFVILLCFCARKDQK